MRKIHWLALMGLVGVLVFGLGWTGFAHSQRPMPLQPLPREIAVEAALEEETVTKVLEQLGPAIARQLASGRQVSLPGLGIFRVVRLPESRNLVDGEVVVEPAVNVVEFFPEAAIIQAANAPGAVPAVEVPAFQYIPLPGQTPSTRTPGGRTPSTRVR